MQHIETVVADGTDATIVVSSIPATFTDLVIYFSLRQATGTNAIANVSFNGVSANLSSRSLEGDGSSATSGSRSSIPPVISYSADTANTFGSGYLYIPNYASNVAKSVSIDAVSENNATAAFQRLLAGLWNDTSAINSITFTSPSGNFSQYSSISLYGITAGSDGIVTVS